MQQAQQSLEQDSRYELSENEMHRLNKDFLALRCTEADANNAMKIMHSEFNKTICPHTATAVHAYLSLEQDTDAETVVVETAHPAKFSSAVEQATGVVPSVPAHASQLMQAEEQLHTVDSNIQTVQATIDKFFA